MPPKEPSSRRKCHISSGIRAHTDMPTNSLPTHLKIVTTDIQGQEDVKCTAVRCYTFWAMNHNTQPNKFSFSVPRVAST